MKKKILVASIVLAVIAAATLSYAALQNDPFADANLNAGAQTQIQKQQIQKQQVVKKQNPAIQKQQVNKKQNVVIQNQQNQINKQQRPVIQGQNVVQRRYVHRPYYYYYNGRYYYYYNGQYYAPGAVR